MTNLLLPAATAVVLTAIAAISLARGADADDLSVSAWARATPPGADVAAAYVTVVNRGDADRLIGAASPAAASVTLHATTETDGIAAMRPLDGVAVPADAELDMRPGGTHLMLSGLSAPLKAGDAFKLTLSFAAAGDVTVPVAVAPIGAEAPHHHGD